MIEFVFFLILLVLIVWCIKHHVTIKSLKADAAVFKAQIAALKAAQKPAAPAPAAAAAPKLAPLAVVVLLMFSALGNLYQSTRDFHPPAHVIRVNATTTQPQLRNWCA